jgi:reverse gyrase
MWDGFIRLADPVRKTLLCGLYDYLVIFAEKNGYTIEDVNIIKQPAGIDTEKIDRYINSLSLCSNDKPITMHDYQKEAVCIALQNFRGILLSPTGSGKSLILYVICRYLQDQNKKIIVVVPTTALVEQMYNDFDDYSTMNDWPTAINCCKIYEGKEKDPQTVKITLEDGSIKYLRGSEYIKTINKGSIKAINLCEGDDIDEKVLHSL